MEISKIKKKYKNKWILAEVLKVGKLQKVLEAKPLIISDDRDRVYRQLSKLKKGSHVTTFYTGEVPPKGMSFTFNVNIKI
ncbi:hypothetical protein A3D78_06160 [Candidatus Gottesmanbacteria bacterium RIFCSPHIGHO2_02_FULL_39_14]|uniref:DUF5678 domain-containing protein n=1 Tax=Candidatus Gottesmanbacteria bacterium RIFCSPHIGHO2_02_FULL_39_14 TaxID=1798383 RepID=A0A1F6A3R8_9BACT|nr:MAG: hypothetical protein A3D78_06160 [Candidatus Gottesmanbacteria bacterium RIFCSPHIGHO2_02_FULL_39_14]